MALGRCDGASSYLPLSPAELKQLLDALDRAVEVAEQGSRRPIPPTLDRPYYASELSCSATPRVENGPARVPSEMPVSQRRYAEVGVRFVVDTSGYVERGSIAVLPGAPAALDRATRELVAGWRYRPAVRGGLPVRQVIATSLVYDPSRPELPPRPPRAASPYQLPGYDVNDGFSYVDLVPSRTSITTSDGWVRVRLGSWNRLAHSREDRSGSRPTRWMHGRRAPPRTSRALRHACASQERTRPIAPRCSGIRWATRTRCAMWSRRPGIRPGVPGRRCAPVATPTTAVSRSTRR